MSPMGKTTIRDEVERHAKRRGWNHSVVLGLTGHKIEMVKGKDYLYVDHSYFKRGWEHGHFRLTRNWVHQTVIKPRPDDRMKKFGVQLEPWRKTGERVVIIPPTEFQQAAFKCGGWTENTEKRLAEITDRPVAVKWEKYGKPLPAFLADAWAVVTWGSVAGVEAALMGIPVFAEPTCPAYPVSAGDLEQIETPSYAENRHEWACSLAYASWHTSEFSRIEYADYDYQIRHDLP
jgi:hypothetical protein